MRFLNNGPGQVPGVVGFEVSDVDGRIDRRWSRIVVVFNAAPAAREAGGPELIGRRLDLHPIQRASGDAVVRAASFNAATGMVSVPGRTTAVFVERRP